MSDFNAAFESTIGHEGGYVNDARDPGGETKYGISKRAYPGANIPKLTLDDAKAIYLRDYWQACKCDLMPDPVAFAVFDLAVNAGRNAAIRDLQTALDVESDGVLGPKTLAAIAELAGAGEAQALRIAVKVHASGLERRTVLSTWAVYGKGWTRRVIGNLLSL